jgi:hypothetical protein
MEEIEMVPAYQLTIAEQRLAQAEQRLRDHGLYCDAAILLRAKIAECNRWAERVEDLTACLAAAEGVATQWEELYWKDMKSLRTERDALKAERDVLMEQGESIARERDMWRDVAHERDK